MNWPIKVLEMLLAFSSITLVFPFSYKRDRIPRVAGKAWRTLNGNFIIQGNIHVLSPVTVIEPV